jgi:hypothetical protein
MGSADSAAHVSLSSIFNCQRTDFANAMSWTIRFWLWPAECRSRGSLGFHKGELFSRQRQHRPRCGAYIVASGFDCQHRKSAFLNFLRRFFRTQGNAPAVVPMWGCRRLLARAPARSSARVAGAAIEPHCRRKRIANLIMSFAQGAGASRRMGIRRPRGVTGLWGDLAFVDFARRGRQLSRQRWSKSRKSGNRFSVRICDQPTNVSVFANSRKRLRRST